MSAAFDEAFDFGAFDLDVTRANASLEVTAETTATIEVFVAATSTLEIFVATEGEISTDG